MRLLCDLAQLLMQTCKSSLSVRFAIEREEGARRTIQEGPEAVGKTAGQSEQVKGRLPQRLQGGEDSCQSRAECVRRLNPVTRSGMLSCISKSVQDSEPNLISSENGIYASNP